MNFQINLHLTASPELLETVNALAGVLPQTKARQIEPVKAESATERTEAPEPVKTAPSRSRTKAKPEEPKEEVPQEAEPVAEPEAGGADVSIEEVRSVVHAKATAGKRDEVKALLQSFGVQRVTDLEPTKWGAFMIKVNAL